MKILEVEAQPYSRFSLTAGPLRPFWQGVFAFYLALVFLNFVSYLRHGAPPKDAATLAVKWPVIAFTQTFVDDVPPRVVYVPVVPSSQAAPPPSM